LILATTSPASSQDPSPDTASLAAQLERLLSDDADEHADALIRITALGEAVVPNLEALSVDSTAHPRYRAGAIFALGAIGASSSEAVLVELWSAGYTALGGALAIQTAIALAEFENYAALREMVESGDEILAAKSAVQLGLRLDTDSLLLLQAAYSAEHYARMRPFFAISLGLLGDGRGEDILRAGLPAIELRNHCAVALSALGHGADVLFELKFSMDDVDPLVRLRALEGLVEREPSDLDNIVAVALIDTDARVRGVAEAAHRQLNRRRRR
jgi:hypothetical protein